MSTYNLFGSNYGNTFPDPFKDVASLAMPDQMRSALYWSEYIFSVFGTYRMAMERVISYLLTDIEFEGDIGEDEKNRWSDLFKKTSIGLRATQDILRDRCCYGNGFASIVVPFRRYLQSPFSGLLLSLSEVYNNPSFAFRFENFEFVATDPATGQRGAWKVIDHNEPDETKLKIRRWSPHEIELLHDLYSDEVAYLWRIPEDYKQQIKAGHLYNLERCPLEVIKAIKLNKTFRFHPNAIFHMKEPTLAGIKNRGWGIPRILTNFRQIYYIQVLRRYNEAIALDYVIPFRVLTPAARAGGQSVGDIPSMDMMMVHNSADFKNNCERMLHRRAKDPASWHVLPFPVQYQMLGGDAQQLAPRDLLDQGMEILLNDAGTPVEMFKGSMQMQAAPVAIRLFESTWHHLVHDANMFLDWIVDQISQLMTWDKIVAKLKKVQIADDIEMRMAAVQMMIGQQISGHSGLKAMGFDWDQEQKRLADEARKQQEIAARIQEQMDQSAAAQMIAKGQLPGQQGAAPAGPGGAPAGPGAPPAGGAPAGGAAPPGDPAAMGMNMPVTSYLQTMGNNVPVTPQDMEATADQLAMDLLGLPESVKDSELRKLKMHNPVLHSVVRAKMDEKRQAAKTQGGAMIMGQQFGQQQPPM